MVATNSKVFGDLSIAIADSKTAVRDYFNYESSSTSSSLREAFGDQIVQRVNDGVYTVMMFESPTTPNKKICLVGDYATLSKDNFVYTLPLIFE